MHQGKQLKRKEAPRTARDRGGNEVLSTRRPGKSEAAVRPRRSMCPGFREQMISTLWNPRQNREENKRLLDECCDDV